MENKVTPKLNELFVRPIINKIEVEEDNLEVIIGYNINVTVCDVEFADEIVKFIMEKCK